MTRKLTGSIIHAGREHHAGGPVPAGVDMERLERLGLVEPAAKSPLHPGKS